MNARGLNDRVAILKSAWSAYTASTYSEVVGIGLGAFYASSAAEFGVPLIVHNTFAWFLFELGPLGLLAVLWIWVQTTANLVRAALTATSDWYLASGVLAAFAGMTVFCLLNEGFYQRQLWLMFVVADRLRMLPVVPDLIAVREEAV